MIIYVDIQALREKCAFESNWLNWLMGTYYFSNLCMLCIGRNRVWHVGPDSDPMFEPMEGSNPHEPQA